MDENSKLVWFSHFELFFFQNLINECREQGIQRMKEEERTIEGCVEIKSRHELLKTAYLY